MVKKKYITYEGIRLFSINTDKFGTEYAGFSKRKDIGFRIFRRKTGEIKKLEELYG